MQKTIQVTEDYKGKIAIATISREEKKNALTLAMYRQLTEVNDARVWQAGLPTE